MYYCAVVVPFVLWLKLLVVLARVFFKTSQTGSEFSVDPEIPCSRFGFCVQETSAVKLRSFNSKLNNVLIDLVPCCLYTVL